MNLKVININEPGDGYLMIWKNKSLCDTVVPKKKLQQKQTQPQHININSQKIQSVPTNLDTQTWGNNEFQFKGYKFINVGLINQSLANSNKINFNKYRFEAQTYDQTVRNFVIENAKSILESIRSMPLSPHDLHHDTHNILYKAWEIFLGNFDLIKQSN